MATPFTTTSGDYLGVIMGIWLRRYWAVPVVPLLALLVMGVLIDPRWLFVALMVAFIIIPMGLSFFYTYYMLTPEARRAVLRKTVARNPDGSLTLTYLPSVRMVAVETPEGDTVMTEQPIEGPASTLPAPETIPASKIRRVRLTSRFKVYELATPGIQVILIPHDAEE